MTMTWDDLRPRAKQAYARASAEFWDNHTPGPNGVAFSTGPRAEATADALQMCKALADGAEPPVQALFAIPQNFHAWLHARGF